MFAFIKLVLSVNSESWDDISVQIERGLPFQAVTYKSIIK